MLKITHKWHLLSNHQSGSAISRIQSKILWGNLYHRPLSDVPQRIGVKGRSPGLLVFLFVLAVSNAAQALQSPSTAHTGDSETNLIEDNRKSICFKLKMFFGLGSPHLNLHHGNVYFVFHYFHFLWFLIVAK